MISGDRVIVTQRWSSFFGLRGVVVRPVDGGALVLVDGERKPMRFGAGEVAKAGEA